MRGRTPRSWSGSWRVSAAPREKPCSSMPRPRSPFQALPETSGKGWRRLVMPLTRDPPGTSSSFSGGFDDDPGEDLERQARRGGPAVQGHSVGDPARPLPGGSSASESLESPLLARPDRLQGDRGSKKSFTVQGSDSPGP